MTSGGNLQDQDLDQGQELAGHAGSPGDIPGGRPGSLDRLEVLIGQWEMAATFEAGYFGPSSPAVTSGGGRVTFEWLEGKYFLTQRFVVEHPAAPSGMAIIGVAEDPESFSQHYYDSRGVARVYQMSLDGGIWKVWRDAPGFCQRFTGVISGDGGRDQGRLGGLRGRAGVEARLRPGLQQGSSRAASMNTQRGRRGHPVTTARPRQPAGAFPQSRRGRSWPACGKHAPDRTCQRGR
jgi:hypothetical protein